MSETYFWCSFRSLSGQYRSKTPYVFNILDYDMEKGYLEYEGHYYAPDEDLPERYEMYLKKTKYNIEIYRREYIQDGKCYDIHVTGMGFRPREIRNPIHRERIWFHVTPSTETQSNPLPDSASHTPQ
jgi:hypothetical protein